MDVKRLSLTMIICRSVFLVTLFQFIECAIKCELPLMNKYMLTGSQYSVTSPMKLCPHVHERCCTIPDEIKLTKLWNQRSLPLLQRHRERVFDNMLQILNFFNNMTAIDPKLILVNQMVTKKIPLRKQACRTVTQDATEADKKRARRYFKFSKQERIQPYPGIQPFKSNFKSRNPCESLYKLSDFVSGAGTFSQSNNSVNSGRNLGDYASSTEGRQRRSAPFNTDRGLGKQSQIAHSKSSPYHRFLRGTKHDGRRQLHIRGFTQGNEQDSTNNSGVISEMSLSNDIGRRNPARSLNSPTREECREYFIIKNSRISERGYTPLPIVETQPQTKQNNALFSALGSIQPSTLAPIVQASNNQNTMSSVNLGQLGSNNSGKPSTLPNQNSQAFGSNTYPQNIPVQQPPLVQASNNQNTMSSVNFRPSARYLATQLNLTQTQPSILKEYTNPQPENLFPQAETYKRLKIQKTECYFHQTSFTKEFIVVNIPKVKYCYGIYRNFLDFDINLFRSSMSSIKGQMTQVLESKKMFYCSLCDPRSHRFFDHKNKVVVYNYEYCRRMLIEHADYIRFFNIIFVEFTNQLLQYVQCFESDANVFSFPFQNIMAKYLERIPFWKKCLRNAQGKGFMIACWSICNKISIQRISPLWDGDVKALERAMIAILSFLRKFDILTSQQRLQFGDSTQANFTAESVYNLRATNNVDGLLTEPLNPSMLISNKRFIANMQLRKWLLGKKSWNTTVDDIDRKEMLVNKFLRYLDMTDTSSIKKMMTSQQRLKTPRMRSYNDSDYINSDRYKSTVNNLINQLYNTTVYSEIFHNDLPRRYLREAVESNIRKFGIEPTNLRHARKPTINSTRSNSSANLHHPAGNLDLEDIKLPDNYVLYKADPIRPISASNYSMIKSFGSRVSHNYTTAEDSQIAKAEPNLEMTSEFYEKNLAGIDVTFYGTILGEDGLDPLKDFPLAMFTYNVTKLIGFQFTPPEKIANEVLHLYMSTTPKSINKFNLDMRESVMSYKDIKDSFPDFKKLRRFEMIQRMFDMRKSPALNKEIEKAKNVVHAKLAEQGHRKKMEEIREKEYTEMKRAKEHAKIDAREKLRVHNHVEHGLFDGLFSGLRNFFVGMFGS